MMIKCTGVNRLKSILIRFYKFYNNISIKSKFLVIQIFTVCFVCLISLFLLYFLINRYNYVIYSQAAQNLSVSASSIENHLRKIENISFRIIADPNIQDYSHSVYESDFSYERFRLLKLISERAVSIANDDPYISSVIFIDNKGNEVTAGKYPSRAELHLKEEIIEKAVAQKGAYVIIDISSKTGTLICARVLKSVKDFSIEPLGVLIMRVDFGNLVDQYISTAYELNLMIYQNDKVVYSNFNDFDIDDVVLPKFTGNYGYDIINIENVSYFVAYTTAKYTGLVYLNIIPYQSIFRIVVAMREGVLISMIVLTLLTIVVNFKLADNLTKPLEQLTSKMKLIQNGAFELVYGQDAEESRMDEIGQLQKNFYVMINKINTLIKEDHAKQIAIKDAQYKALQAQINPHFLYNTLDSINWMAKLNKQHEISRMVEALGCLLRSSISKKEAMISVEQELEILHNYITIQKMRYGDRLIFEIDVPMDYFGYYVPKLSFQPVVENCINYALETMLGTCIIKLRACAQGEEVKFYIEDNGPGISQELLSKINKGEVESKGTGIGLKNIDERIKMAFGRKYGIVIQSRLGQGTTVIITIPRRGSAVDV